MAASAQQGETDGAVGNGAFVICGQFEPFAVVTLFHMADDNALRAEGGVQVDMRCVDQKGEIGFVGLTPGDNYIAAGHSAGRYVEVRGVAQDPSSGVTLLQPPVQPSPSTVGTQGTTVLPQSAAQGDGAADLGKGIPDETDSPMLTAEGQRADADVSPGDVDTVAPVASVDEAVDVDEKAKGDDGSATPAPGLATVGSVTTDAPTTEANVGAPGAGEPNASESSGTGTANGGAIESSTETAAAESPDVDTAPADGSPATAESDALPTDLQRLVGQATALDVPNAAGLSEDELRQTITEKGATPVV